MLGLFDSVAQVFAALAAGLGVVVVWLFRLWQGQKEEAARERMHAENEKGKRLAEQASRVAAEQAKADAEKRTQEAEERAASGQLDHFET